MQRDLYSAFLLAYLEPQQTIPSITQPVWEGAEPRLQAVMEELQQRANEGQHLPRSMGLVARRKSGAARAGARRLQSPAYLHQELVAPSGEAGTVGEEQEPPCIYAGEASENPTLPARLVVNLISTDATGEVISIYDAHGKELLSLATIPRGIDSHRFPGELSQRGRQGFCGSRCLWCEKMLGWGD